MTALSRKYIVIPCSKLQKTIKAITKADPTARVSNMREINELGVYQFAVESSISNDDLDGMVREVLSNEGR